MKKVWGKNGCVGAGSPHAREVGNWQNWMMILCVLEEPKAKAVLWGWNQDDGVLRSPTDMWIPTDLS